MTTVEMVLDSNPETMFPEQVGWAILIPCLIGAIVYGLRLRPGYLRRYVEARREYRLKMYGYSMEPRRAYRTAQLIEGLGVLACGAGVIVGLIFIIGSYVE